MKDELLQTRLQLKYGSVSYNVTLRAEMSGDITTKPIGEFTYSVMTRFFNPAGFIPTGYARSDCFTSHRRNAYIGHALSVRNS